MPAAGLAYFVLLMFAVKTTVRNVEWWDTEYLAESGMKTNPLNAKMFMTMGNVLAQKVCGMFLCIGIGTKAIYSYVTTIPRNPFMPS